MTTWYRVSVPFDVQAPDGLSVRDLSNVIAERIAKAGVKLPRGWDECSPLIQTEFAPDVEIDTVPLMREGIGRPKKSRTRG